jgi:hypothetical protein
MTPSTARQVVLFSCLALAALTARPVWKGIEMIRAPDVIRAERLKGVLVEEGPPSAEELRNAERVLMHMGPDAVAKGFTPEQVAAAVASNRMMDRALHEAWQWRQAVRLEAALKRRKVGFAVVATCAAVLLAWGIGGVMLIRKNQD